MAYVSEDPDGLAYITTYTYDVLDNLTVVDQGSVDRSYTYDSLSRLSDATNPESGTTSYTYYDNGQLETRTDSRSIKTTYTYDAQGRLTARSYDTGPTPPATFIYGDSSTAQPNRGQLIEVRTGSVATKTYSYDKLGRIMSSTQITDEQPYLFGYTYNLADSVKSMTYPSGIKTVVYDYRPFSGQLIEVGRTGDADYYLDAATYAPHGAPATMTLGNGVTETTDYNSRLQPAEIDVVNGSSLLTLGFNYNTENNNGNLLSQTIAAPGMGSVTQHYRYDQLNRLSIASEGVAPLGSAPNFTCSGSAAWCQTYHYDRYGNRGMQGTTPTPVLAPFCASSSGPGCNSSTTTLTPAYTTTSNRLNSTWGDYDLAGNVLAFKDPIGSGTRDWSAAYDAENKQTFFCGGTTATCNSGNANAQYIYDGEGNRVQKLTAGVTETYVYDAFGRLAAEYTTATPTVDPGSYWRTTDHLGSTRLVTTGVGAVYDRRDLFPFGEQIADTYSSRTSAGNYNESDPASRHLFTAKERDDESGLDYFGARYFGSSLGRFNSPDPLLNSGRPWLPQSWNRYAYTLNNPLRFTDPTGMYEWDSKCKSNDSACEENRQKFRDGVAELNAALAKAEEGSEEYNAIKKVLDKIGTEGDGNNVRVAFNSKLEDFGKTRPGAFGNIKMTFNFEALDSSVTKGGYKADDVAFARAALIAHEGTHAAEGFGRGIKWLFSGQERMNFEGRAYNTESFFYKTINRYEPFGPLWNPAWLEADRDKIEQKRREAVEGLTERLYGGRPKIY